MGNWMWSDTRRVSTRLPGGGQPAQARTCLLIYPYTGHRQIAIYWLDQGSHLNLSNVKGNKALRDLTEASGLGVQQVLFRCQTHRERNGYVMTPLLVAHMTDHRSMTGDLTQEQPAGEETQPRQPGKGTGKWSKPKEPRDSVQFTKALDIILHLLYLLEKVECHPDQEDMKPQRLEAFLRLY
ncbi:hypothetical protein CapIbe_023566 [Capra ibex]